MPTSPTTPISSTDLVLWTPALQAQFRGNLTFAAEVIGLINASPTLRADLNGLRDAITAEYAKAIDLSPTVSSSQYLARGNEIIMSSSDVAPLVTGTSSTSFTAAQRFTGVLTHEVGQ